MSDTRCANPAYQLDVDEMMVEYALYHATKFHVGDVNGNGTTTATQRCSPVEIRQSSTAMRLLEIFDELLSQFKRHHPTHRLSETTDFAIQLFEFALLLIHRHNYHHGHFNQHETPTQTNTTIFSARTLSELETASILNARLRRAEWDRAAAAITSQQQSSQQPTSSNHNNNNSGPLDPSEIELINQWSSIDFPWPPSAALSAATNPNDDDNERNPKTNLNHPRPQIPLSNLLPRFMALSAHVSAALDQPINSKWMKLAAEFMVHAAMEELVLLDRDRGRGAAASVADTLKVCFGWGLLASSPLPGPSRGTKATTAAEAKIAAAVNGDGEGWGNSSSSSIPAAASAAAEAVTAHEVGLESEFESESESSINAMFADANADEEEEEEASDSNSSWAKIRSAALRAAFNLDLMGEMGQNATFEGGLAGIRGCYSSRDGGDSGGDREEEVSSSPVNSVDKSKRNDIETFETELLYYIRSLWTVWHSCAGKPILVQIEEGGLHSLGLDDDGFRAFLERVGLGGS